MAPRINMKKGIASHSTEWALFDSRKGRIYQRIYGGIVLQGHRGAAAAVIAEEAVLRPPAPQFLVGLATASDASGIIERAMEFKKDLHCDDWFNDYTDKAALRFLDRHDSAARERRESPLHVGRVAHADIGLGYFLNVLKEALTPGKRLLNLEGHEGEVNSALAAISAVEITTAKFEDHPLVAALAMAASELVSSPFVYGESRPRTAQFDYDLFTREPIERRERHENRYHRRLQERAKTDYDLFGNR